MRPPVIAVDMGATHLRIARVSAQMEIEGREHHPLPPLAASELQSWVARTVLAAASDGEPVAVAAAGVVWDGATVCWKRSGVPQVEWWDWTALAGAAVVVNDAAAAATAEARLGMLHGVRRGLGLTVGTALGAALVIDGSVHATEIGMLQYGPAKNEGAFVEISGTGLVGLARAVAEKERESDLHALFERTAEVRGIDVGELALSGCSAARRAVAQLGARIGTFVATYAPALLLERVSVGGGISALGELITAPAQEALRAPAGSSFRKLWFQNVEIVPARFGPDANLIGAACAYDDMLTRS